jgi:hypothetical protein
MTDVPIDVGVAGHHGPGAPRRPVGQAGLRSSPAEQHAPKARPPTHHPPWPAGRPGRPSSANGCTVGTCAAAGSRTFALDRRASRPSCTTPPRGEPAAAKPGGGSLLPPGPPSSPRPDRHGRPHPAERPTTGSVTLSGGFGRLVPGPGLIPRVTGLVPWDRIVGRGRARTCTDRSGEASSIHS